MIKFNNYIRRYSLQDDRTASYVQALDRSINERNPQLTLCVVPNNRADRYCAIKKKCIIDKPSKRILVTCYIARGGHLQLIV